MRRAALWSAAWLAVACGGEAAPGQAGPTTPVVEVATAELRQQDRSVSALASVEPRDVALVSSGIAGIIRSVHFEEGDELTFEAGGAPVLFRLDSSILNSEVEDAQRRVDATQAELAEAEATFERKKTLFEDKAATRAAFDDAKFAVDRARAAKARAQAGVVGARRQAGQATIRAPFPGVLGERRVSVGQFVHAGQPLVEIVARDRLVAAFSLPERHLPDLSPGAPVTARVAALGDRAFEGTITYVAPAVDPATRTIKVKAELVDPDRALRPGMSARVAISLSRGVPSVVVPEQAIDHRGEKVFVLVLDGDKVRSQEITIGERLPGEVIVARGLKGGERVVVSGFQRISDGAAVKIRE